MLKIKLVLLSLVLLSSISCTKIADLMPPHTERTIVLDKDYLIRHESENLWRNSLIGLRSGNYVFVGSNEKGDYYLGKRPSLLFLYANDVEYYLNGGELTREFASKNQFPRTVNNGGFVVGKSENGLALQLFYINEPVVTGFEAGGLIGAAGVQMAKGSIELWPQYEFKPELKKLIESQL